jgi:hypothetical protein
VYNHYKADRQTNIQLPASSGKSDLTSQLEEPQEIVSEVVLVDWSLFYLGLLEEKGESPWHW